MNAKMTQSLDKAAMAVGFVLFFGIMISKELRDGLGVVTGYVIGWLPDILPIHMVIFILAAITGLYASLIQKYTMDWEFLRTQQEKMKKLQRNMKEAQLSGDKAKIQAMQNEQMKAVSEQGKMMQMQFKPMLYIGILTIPLFMWANFYIPNANPVLEMTFPFWGTHPINSIAWGPFIYWYYWYFICSLPVSQIIRKALDIGSMS